jgi:hypothetical protein
MTATNARLTLLSPAWLSLELECSSEEDVQVLREVLREAQRHAGDAAVSEGPSHVNGKLWAGMIIGGDCQRARTAASLEFKRRRVPFARVCG